MADIINNVNEVKRKIAAAAKRINKNPKDIKLVAVSKTVNTDKVLIAHKAGISNFGENRAQELSKKYNEISNFVNWHYIGYLQRNKVKHIIDKAVLIHSLDRYSLAEEINKQAKKVNKIMEVLVQVNVAEEKTKSGLNIKETESFISEAVNNFCNIKINGLMTIAPYVNNPEEVRPVFAELKELFKNINNNQGMEMKYLSMGMTNDYTVAIEEGANILRIGTAIFGSRNKLEV